MKITDIILKGVYNFSDFSYCFEDDWMQSAPDTLLVIGANGSGKTTLLRAIGNLWQILRLLLEGRSCIQTQRFSLFYNTQLAAMSLSGLLPEEKFWIYQGRENEVRHFLQAHQSEHKIGAIRVTTGNTEQYKIHYVPAGQSEPQDPSLSPFLSDLRDRYVKNRLGGRADLANMILLLSEKRTLERIEEQAGIPELGIEELAYRIVPEKEDFHWLALYHPTSRRKGSIENYLFTLKAINVEKYERIVNAVNLFLWDKKIIGFDSTTGDLLIEPESKQIHPAHLLSSGEKQMLLMTAFIARELRPGGMVLIDEPDLHLHVSLNNAFVNHLKRMVAEQNGQLIITSHSPEVWQHFTEAQELYLDSV